MTALRVLVIEDDALIGLLLSEMLEEQGLHVCAVAATEADAIAAALVHKPGLIIADIRLRGGSGLVAVAAIEKTGLVPHVFTSGLPVYTGRPDDVILQKPFLEQDLVDAIQRALGSAIVLAAVKSAPPHIVPA